MNDLFESIRSSIAYKFTSDGNIQTKKVKGSSINLPEIDEDRTRRNAEVLVRHLISQGGPVNAAAQLKIAVNQAKSLFTSTHDGFRVAKGAGKGNKMTISDLYAFSIAAGYCFDFLPSNEKHREVRIGIGVMAPAVQDCGKNLIKLIWKAAGYTVLDLGASVQPKGWLEEILSSRLSVVAVSCMTNKCLGNLDRLVEAMAKDGCALPVVIGGIAVNRMVAYDLERRYSIRIYYGYDLNDAESVLDKALSRAPAESPSVKQVEEITLPAEATPTLRNSFRLFRVGVSDIVVSL